MALPTTISGFQIIPVSYSASSTHYIYIRSHTSSKKPSRNPLPNGRTLFLVNVPPDGTERELSTLFKGCGTVERVIFNLDDTLESQQDDESDDEDDDDDGAVVDGSEALTRSEDQPRKRRKIAKDDGPKVAPLPCTSLRSLRATGRTAHLVFLDCSSLERALATASKRRTWPSAASEEPSGLSHYTALYDALRPPLDAVCEHADTSIRVYEHEVAKAKQKTKYRKGETIVDEDGFTLVTRGGAYGKTLGGGVGVASKRFERTGRTSGRSRGTKKKQKEEKMDFYGFQKAERQRKALIDLRSKWEEDKARVDALKASRKFRPY